MRQTSIPTRAGAGFHFKDNLFFSPGRRPLYHHHHHKCAADAIDDRQMILFDMWKFFDFPGRKNSGKLFYDMAGFRVPICVALR